MFLATEWTGRELRPVDMPEGAVDRFLAKIEAVDGHWIWTGGVSGGAGVFAPCAGRVVKAHRLAWALFNGPIPDETPCVVRPCGVEGCIHPACLRVCTETAAHTGRLSKPRHTGVAVSPKMVQLVRTAIAQGKHPTEICRATGLGAGTIARIGSGDAVKPLLGSPGDGHRRVRT